MHEAKKVRMRRKEHRRAGPCSTTTRSNTQPTNRMSANHAPARSRFPKKNETASTTASRVSVLMNDREKRAHRITYRTARWLTDIVGPDDTKILFSYLEPPLALVARIDGR